MKIAQAVQGLQKERARMAKQLEGIDAAIAALGGARKKKRTMSAAVRKKIARSQRARWKEKNK